MKDPAETDKEKEYALSRALHYLKFRPRSREEIRQYLQKKGVSEPVCKETIQHLEAYRYVDDAAFARMWVESRSRNRPRGAFALRHELRQKGIAGELIERALADFREADPALRAVLPRLKLWTGLAEPDLKKKIYAFLKRRGFSYETCEHVFIEALARRKQPDSGGSRDPLPK